MKTLIGYDDENSSKFGAHDLFFLFCNAN